MSPTFSHAYMSKQITRQIDLKFIDLPELTLDIGENGLTPDISIYHGSIVDQFESMEQMLKAPTKFDQMPLLAIEILSPKQSVGVLIEKAEKLIAGEVPVIWVVEPFAHVVIVVTPKGQERIFNGVVKAGEVKVDFQQVFNLKPTSPRNLD